MTRRLPLLIVLLLAFGLYAGAVGLMPFHDDAVLMPAINNRTLLTIWENRPYGDGHHRPMSYVPWLLTRDVFGWFAPSILHWWNLAAHALNTALVGALARRLTRGQGLRLAPPLAMLIFAAAPLSYEAVLWASALVHPLMTLFGQSALHAALYARKSAGGLRRALSYGLAAMLLLLACTSHEMGFIFGVAIVWLEALAAIQERRRLNWSAAALAAIGLAYALNYRFRLITKWTDPSTRDYARGPFEWLANSAWQAQSLVALPVRALRELGVAPAGGDGAFAPIMTVLALAVMLVSLALLLARRPARLAALSALGLWAICAAPSALLLTQDYVWSSPRMSYAPAAGAAVFWSVALCSTLQRVRGTGLRRALTGAGLAAACAAALWNAHYVRARLIESLRLTPVLRAIDADLRASAPDARLLLINSSFVNLATRPAFWLGREGMPIWEYGYKIVEGPLWAWPAALSNIRRETQNVRHEPSLSDRDRDLVGPEYFFTRGSSQPFRYGVFGELTDDGGLRNALLRSDIAYRFEYDPPGFRATRVWLRAPGITTATAPALATFAAGRSRIDLLRARAWTCGAHSYLAVSWRLASAPDSSAAVFVHGYDKGAQVLSADRDPAGGHVPIELLPPGQVISETRELRPEPDDAQPLTELRLGVYDRATGARFAALRAEGAWPGDEVVVPVFDANRAGLDSASPLQSSSCP